MPKKVLQGTVVSKKNNKTIIVDVKRRIRHPIYEKVITRSKRYAVHDEKNKYTVGNEVQIRESKPYSKTKRFEVL